MRASLCTDISGAIKGAWGGKFYDNGHYIGHDEPDTTFLSNAPGSGGNVNWTETLGRDPSGGARKLAPGIGPLAVVRAHPRAVVLHGPVRPQLLPRDALHAEFGLQRADLRGHQLRAHDPGRRLGVHGDAAVPAGQRALRGQREL